MTKPRKRRRRGGGAPGEHRGDSKDPDRQPSNLDHRKGHNSLLRAGLPDQPRGGRVGGYRSNNRGSRSH